MGLIRNLRTGYISPQFHVVYDNLFQTVMGGYENNDTISDHIWSSLVQGSDNVTEQAVAEHEPVPPVHADWLDPTEQHHRREQFLGEEVNRRVRMDRDENLAPNWNDLNDPAPVPPLKDCHQRK